MVKQVARDRPLSFEEVGVIGAVDNAVASDVEPRLSEEQSQAAARPASAGVENTPSFYASGFDRIEDEAEPEAQELPEGFEEWPAFRVAVPSIRTRADFTHAVLFPNFVFIAPGRYVNAQDISKVYDVSPGEVSPDGLYLLGVNYLVPGPERDRILRGERQSRAATRQPNPLRPEGKKE